MKKIILALLISSSLFTQYQLIYQAPENRFIQTITLYSGTQTPNPRLYLHLSGHSINALPPYWIRYFKSSSLWNTNPHNGMLGGSTCFNGQGGFSWSKNAVLLFSPRDSNFILTRYDWITCMFQESGYWNRISYNSGTNYTDNSSIGLYAFDIDEVNDSLIYGVGSRSLEQYKFWRTTNKGLNWINNEIGGSSYDISFIKINPLNRNQIFFSRSGNLYKSTNFGINFSQIGAFLNPIKQIIINKTDSIIFILAGNSGIYKSTNNGTNFLQVSLLNLNSIIYHPENHLIIYGASANGIYRSTNGGLNWNIYFTSFAGEPNVNGLVKYPNDGDTIYASNNSGLYKIWASSTGLIKLNNEVPGLFSLSQNYPNPFNPVTKIKFDIPKSSLVRLIIYDMVGREIAILTNQQMNPGTYEADWDASGYPSGIYFYKLTAGDFTETKKMMLVK